MKAISWALNALLGLSLFFLGYLYINETNKYSEVLQEFSKIENDYKNVLLNAKELAKYEPCYNQMDKNPSGVLWRPDTCLEIVWNKYSELKKKTSPVDEEDSALTTCRTDLNNAKKEIKKLEADFKEANKKITELKETVTSKEPTTVAKNVTKKPKKKFQKPDSSRSGDNVVTSGDCFKTCNDMVAAAVDPLEKTIAGLKTELTTAQELNENYQQVIKTLEADVQNKARKIQELEQDNNRLIRELGDDGFSGDAANIRGVPSHTNNVGCALSWSTAQPHAPPMDI